MSNPIIYSIENPPFLAQAAPVSVANVELRDEIETSPNVAEGRIKDIATKGDSLEIWFLDDPSQDEIDAADAAVAAHGGELGDQSDTLITTAAVGVALAVTEDASWQDIDVRVTSVAALVKKMSRACGHVVGQAQVSGAGFEMRIVRGSDPDPTSLMAAAFSQPETAGGWAFIVFETDVDPVPGLEVYRLQARLNGATSASIRGVSMSIRKKREK